MPMTPWDGKMHNNWSGFKLPPFISEKGVDRLKLSVECTWEPPQEVWWKLNFDGASRSDPSIAGIGCCVREH